MIVLHSHTDINYMLIIIGIKLLRETSGSRANFLQISDSIQSFVKLHEYSI